jgi:hypothetical protein
MPPREVELHCGRVGVSWRRVQAGMKAAGVEAVREGFGRDARYL